MTVIVGSTSAAVALGSPVAVTSAVGVGCGQGALALASMASDSSAMTAAVSASTIIVNGAISGAMAATSGLTTVIGASGTIGSSLFVATVTGSNGSAASLIAKGALGAVVKGAIVGAAGAISSVSQSAAGFERVASASIFAGSIGLAVLGADDVTWDCWKPVVMDLSKAPSQGLTLRDLYNHPNIRNITVCGEDLHRREREG